MSEAHDTAYYFQCMIGGALACGLTHTAILPLEFKKVKIASNSYKRKGMAESIKKIISG